MRAGQAANVAPSWRYADLRAGLFDGAERAASRSIICRTLGLSAGPEPTLTALAYELDSTYRAVVARLPDNQAVRFKTVAGKPKLVLSNLDKIDESASLADFREKVTRLLPRVDLPELILKIAARTGCTDAFSHLSERTARAADPHVSLCAVLMAEACNTGMEPLIRGDFPAQKRDRLSRVNQNYLRDDTLTSANALLVAAQSGLGMARLWGEGNVASTGAMRFVVPVRSVHAGPNSKYFGVGRGATRYNLLSDRLSGLNAITVPETLRDSLILLAVVLDQQTDFPPTQIVTDTGAYSDVVFDLCRLRGYRFSPRLADVGSSRFSRRPAQGARPGAQHDRPVELALNGGCSDRAACAGAPRTRRRRDPLVAAAPRAHQYTGPILFSVPDAVAKGELRALRDPTDCPA